MTLDIIGQNVKESMRSITQLLCVPKIPDITMRRGSLGRVKIMSASLIKSVSHIFP